MQIRYEDFNDAGDVIRTSCAQQWEDLQQVLTATPLHLKASDQAGIQGRAIFDPVGTNRHIANQLVSRNWRQNIPIPEEFRFLGTGVDFGRDGVVAEVQFSNYPFLLNNTQRSDLFFRAHTVFDRRPTSLVVIITKAAMFPSSNSTLYYEQALQQLQALARYNGFAVPIRLIGLFERIGQISATWTTYTASRYSREIRDQSTRLFNVQAGRAARSKIVPASD